MKIEFKKIYKCDFQFANSKEKEALGVVESMIDDIDHFIRSESDGDFNHFFNEKYDGDILDFLEDLNNEPCSSLAEKVSEYIEEENE